ncbi:outer membrane beta-barrel protein [uncultured Sphingomonas sp.]|uniref:outer membrane protein n=1 Tax=uncultured Sphingomonas sp. TaxID=158754 RepID=UPI0025CEF476|nr:outer membrane beta-barrel protein [uncultured Sphingomonas sp.]
MRKTLLATAIAVVAVASPAAARDGSPYIGIEGGVLFPKDQDANVDVDFTTTQTPATPAGPAGPVDVTFDNAYGLDYKRGRDLDVIAGYDFGAFRLEGEVAFKRARLNDFEVDGDFITALNTALNRPSVAPDTGAPGLGALSANDVDLNGRVKVRTLMLNGLLDFGNEDGLSFYAGAGIGRARVRFAGARDSSWAGQLIAGARYAVTPNIDLGLKYRHLRTRKLGLTDDVGAGLAGNPNTVNVGTVTAPVLVDQTTNATLFSDFEQRFRSHSLLASLIFNFAAPEAALPPPPPPVEAAPPPPPPQTQTCPDGSVILATDVCPAPPPPPPPPPPAPERG